MKTILYICETTSGGVRKHVMDLLKNLPESKYEVYFLYSENRADNVFYREKEELRDKVTFISNNHMIREISIENDWKAFKEIYKVIKSVKPDIVHCHSSKAGALGRLAAKLAKVKKIYYTPHAYSTQNQNISLKKKLLLNFIERVLSKFCTTKTLAVSNGEKAFALQSKIDQENKFEVIYNGIDEKCSKVDRDLMKLQLGVKNDELVIGVAARMDEQKDPWTFVGIAEGILQKHDKVKFIYIGNGKYKDEVEEYINQKKLQDKILLLGFRDDVENLLQVFNIYLITSIYEGLPYSLIEALKARLPIVATNVVGNDEIVVDEFNGLLFKVQDIEDGVLKLEKLIDGSCNINTMKDNSYQLFKDNFTIDKMIKRIIQVYEN